MLNLILTALFFVLPAYVANMMPVFFAKAGWLKALDRPVDGGHKLGNQEIFGSHKTWRGLVAGTLGGIVTALLLAGLCNLPFFNNLALFNYSQYWFAFGALAGSGAILGDLIKSFFKRRIGIKPGSTWLVFDQLDFVFGFFLFTAIIVWPGWKIFVVACLATLILHPLSNILGKLLGLKKNWF